MTRNVISGVSFADSLSSRCNFLTQLRRIEDFNASGFTQYPADHLMFKCWFQCDNKRTVILSLYLELFHFLVLIKVKRNGGVTVKADTFDWRVFKQTIALRPVQQFLIRFKRINTECDRGYPLNRIGLGILCTVFVSLDIPDSVMKCASALTTT